MPVGFGLPVGNPGVTAPPGLPGVPVGFGLPEGNPGVTAPPGLPGVPVGFGVPEGDFVTPAAPGFAGLNPPLTLPFSGVALPFGPPVGDGLTPPGGVEAPKAVAPGFGEAVGNGPPLSTRIGATVGFGRFGGVGFSLAILVLSSFAVFGSTPFQPLSTTGCGFLIVAGGSFVATGFNFVPGPVTFSTPLLMLEPGVFPGW